MFYNYDIAMLTDLSSAHQSWIKSILENDDSYRFSAKVFQYNRKLAGTITTVIGIITVICALYGTSNLHNTILCCIQLLFFISYVYKIALFLISVLLKSDHGMKDVRQLQLISIANLPTYTILVPVYRENDLVIQNIVKSLEGLIYDRKKLEVIFILENDDFQTISAIQSAFLLSYMRYIIVPHSLPKTKPKACNYALRYVRSQYVVIYDAEDLPDPRQLLYTASAFSELPKNYVCIQCHLNYYNRNDTLLTKLFSIEYLFLFKYILSGLNKVGIFIPLGGTSNHFKTDRLFEIGGWDSYNVTEDAELGIRIFQNGLRTAVLNSTTLEEAPCTLIPWLKQRTRWIKGHIQTFLLVLFHKSYKFNHHRKRNIFSLFFVLGSFIVFIFIPFSFIYGYIIVFQDHNVSMPLHIITYCNLSFFAIYPLIMIYICLREGWYNLILTTLLVPIYFLLHIIATYMAVIDLIHHPFRWSKTKHIGVKR